MDFSVDGLATGRMVRILSVVDAYTRECLAPEADTSLGRPENLRSDNGPEFTSRRMLAWSEDWTVGRVQVTTLQRYSQTSHPSLSQGMRMEIQHT